MTEGPKDIPESDYDGPVYHEDAWNDGYCQDTGDFRDYWESARGDDSPLPSTVWACTVTPLRLPSALSLIEQMTEEAYDGAADDMLANRPAIAALQQAIDAFNAAHGCQQYDVDYSRRVVLASAPSTPEPDHDR